MLNSDEEWLLLSYQDEPDSTTWGGENVYDVRTTSGGVGLNGIPYKEW
jgi:general secretion pathway protein G